ncbi:MAG: hypothetical protein JST84_00840 [Acidobacteria bacterium]|nr:hypothetical protein [Acidobacteriota bacterium]
MKMQSRSLLIGFLLIGVSALFAQPARPTLTTEDVIKWRAANPDRAEHFIPKQPSAPQSSKSQVQTDAEFFAAEKDWNTLLSQARTRVRDFERRANQSDLDASQSRNVVFHNDPNALNISNVRVAELQNLAKAYRYEARLAQEDVNRLLDEGRQRGFQLASIAPRLKNGEPNLEYYRTRFLELQSELRDAQARADVLQLRTNRVQTVINSTLNTRPYYPAARHGILFYPNNGAGDLFYVNRLRDAFADVGGDFATTQTRIAILTAQIEELQEEGRRAGVPPGIFR